MGGYGHDRAGPVFGENEVGHPDRHLLPGERIDGRPPGVEAFLLGRRKLLAARLRLKRSKRLSTRLERRILLAERFRQRMLRGQHDKRRAVDRVDSRRKDLDVAAADKWKLEAGAF